MEKFGNNGAWAVATMYHGVCVGLWDGQGLKFHAQAEYDPDCVTETRVFNAGAELRLVRIDGRVISRYADDEGKDIFDTAYLMYGTDIAEQTGDWTRLTEQRGGGLYFPKRLEFEKDRPVALWLKIRHYLQYNPVAVAANAQTGKPALETADYRYLGFAQGVERNPESENYGKAMREVRL
jgi:CRISPR-associated protein (TIGR03984 family)